MSFDIADDRRYLETHEWAKIDDESDIAHIGISDFAQDELGDIVFVELPEVGDAVVQEEAFGVVESIKAVSDLYAPLTGTVSAVNEAVFDAPELLNEDPFGEGWLLELSEIDTDEVDNLLTPEAYEEQIE